MPTSSTSLTVERYDYRAGVVLSILVHIALLLIIQRQPQRDPVTDQVISVVFEPPAAVPSPPEIEAKTQIVSPPENSQPVDVAETNLLSEKNNRVEHQQIHRGDHPQAGRQASKSKAAPQPQKDSNAQPKASGAAPAISAANEITTLKLDQQTLITKFSGQSGKGSAQSSNNTGYRAFSRPMGSGAAFIGLKGTTDFLPNLPDGDITLLNTKADRFAVFVRRVASQVFGQLRASGWENLSASDIARMSNDTTITVVMSMNGTLESIKLENGSGSNAFDRVVVEAARHGARDPNPPKDAAASDGKIHFTFQARSWVQAATNQRTGAPTERRWLLLATGLD